MAELISVILTTYNRADALDAALRALARQTDDAFEVVVADDGSGPSTRDMIGTWRGRLGRPLTHIWHEDRGFRAAEIRNRAIAASRGGYCLFLDGDCLAFPGFVAAHRALAEPGWFVTGNRILLSPALTQQVLRGGERPETWSPARWIGQWRRGGVNRLAPALALPLGPLRKLAPRRWQGIRSANLAVWRADLERVDGFDAAYSGWGREDSDLVVRLLRAGLRRKDGRFATGVLHLWHAENDRSRLADNDARLQALLGDEAIRARRGLSALAAAGGEVGPIGGVTP